MNQAKLQELEDSIRNASSLNLASTLQEAELYDKRETRAVVDEVYEEFNKQGRLVDEVVVPVFTAVVDGLLESNSATRKLRKKGLTTTRLVNECKKFSYDSLGDNSIFLGAYDEFKNARDYQVAYAEQIRAPYSPTSRQKLYEDKSKMDAYKEAAFQNNGGRINARDEYTDKKDIYKEKAHPDARRNIQKYRNSHLAEVDHITPLKRIHEQFAGNYALTDEDIKSIANDDSNLALTCAAINRGEGAAKKGRKLDLTNEEFVKDQERREKNGESNQGLSKETKERMCRMGDESQAKINEHGNERVFANLTGQGTGDSGEIWGKAAGNAASQSKDYVVGNVILFIIKPLYYEISDIFSNGLKEGVNAETTMEAFRIRFGRVKNYVLEKALAFLGDNVWEFVKGFVSSLIEGIISLFIGIFKQVLKVVKEGIKIFIQSGKILWGSQGKEMTTAQKGDAIIKLIGGSVISICGIGIETLLNKIGIMEPWSVVFSTMLSGIASALFMLLLDKADLFSVNAEKRRMRIEDIFDERIKDIDEAMKSFNITSLETMRSQRLQFVAVEREIYNGVDSNNIYGINNGLFALASFMHVDLGYKNREEFVEKFDGMSISL